MKKNEKNDFVSIGLMVLVVLVVSVIVGFRAPIFNCAIFMAKHPKTITTTIYATLITILLALLALAVTAYIFISGSLKERKAPYEQESIRRLLRLYTNILLFLAILSIFCLLLCFLIDNAYVKILSASSIPPWVITLSSIVSLLLLIYTCIIIRHEKLLIFLASCSRKKLFPASSGLYLRVEPDDIFKWIGDLEMLAERLTQNHRENFHTASDKSILRGVTNEEFESTYQRLILYRDFLRVEDCTSLGYPEYHTVRGKVRELEKLLREQFLQGEQLQNQSFIAPFLSRSAAPLHLNGTVFTNSVFEKNPKLPFSEKPDGIDFHNAELQGADFTHARLNYVNLKGADCTEAVFKDAVLNQIQVDASSCFERAVFQNTDFGGWTFRAMDGNICFKSASFESALLANCVFAWCDFYLAVFNQAAMSNIELRFVRLSYADLSGAVMTNAKLVFPNNSDGFDEKICRVGWKGCWVPSQCTEKGRSLPAYTDLWGERWFGPALFVNLEKCVLTQAYISDYNFTGSRMSRANFSDSHMGHCILDRCYGQKATFQETQLENCRFSFAMFNLVDLSYAHIIACDFSDCDLQDSLLVHTTAVMNKENFRSSCFCRANFTHAQVRACKFKFCDFTGALLEDADLRGSVFKNCILKHTSFRDSDLRGTIFQNCNLTGADFKGIDLTVCKMIKCKGP